jgi:hypothetical protein
MGQKVTVVEKPSNRAGIYRYELNRVLTGMGHERYRSLDEVYDNRPPDVLARRLFERGGIAAVHINGNMVTVEMASSDSSGVRQIIEDLYTYYLPGVEPPADDELTTPEAIAAAAKK